MASVSQEPHEKSRLAGGGYYDEELGDHESEALPLAGEWRREIRNGFIRKVYMILSCQLLMTFSAVLVVMTEYSLKNWFIENQMPLMISGAAGLFVATMVMLCCCRLLRYFPWNYVILALLTVSQTLLVTSVVARFPLKPVVLALASTLLIVIGLTCFAFQTKCDFTAATTGMLVATLVLLCFGVFTFVLGTWSKVLYSTLAIGLFGMWLVIDTQYILGGKRSYQFTEDDYIVAAIALYTDIINIFLELHYLFQ